MTEENTTEQAETPVNTTLRDELTAALNAANEKQQAEAQAEAGDAAQDEEAQAAEEQDDEEVDSEEVAEDEAEGDEVAEQVEKEFPVIPNDMSDEEKEIFQNMLDSDNEEIQLAAQLFLDRYNNLKRGFYDKAKASAEATKEMEKIDHLFAPFDGFMQQRGIDRATYMGNMIKWEQALSQQPVETLKQLMNQYKVSPKDLGAKLGYEDDEDENDFEYDEDYGNNKKSKKEAALEKRIELLENQIANQPVQVQLDNFKSATDPQTGELKHPRYEEVKQIMGALIQQGKASTLEIAYKKAIRALDEESSEPPISSVSKTSSVDAARKKVAQARKANKSVTNKGGNRVDYSKMSLRQELQAHMGKQT